MLPAVRAAVRELDPNLPLFDVRTVDEHMRISTFIARMAASMLGLFGFWACCSPGVGLYGVIAFNAAQRTREIGLRMALGADRAQVVWLVLRDGFALAAVGIGGGPGARVRRGTAGRGAADGRFGRRSGKFRGDGGAARPRWRRLRACCPRAVPRR